MNIKELIKEAFAAREYSYAPYSGFKVGAALLTGDGSYIRGCNVENASYGMANCAERTAIFKAVSEGINDFVAIAIVGGKEDLGPVCDYAYPCGACRQVMREFCNPQKFIVIVAKSQDEYKQFYLSDLLPDSFGPDNLEK